MLRFFRDIAHRENNQMLHLSAQSLGQVVHARGPEGITFQLGPGGDFIDRALFGSFWIFIQTLTLLLDQFVERDRDAEADLFSDTPFRKPTARLDRGFSGQTCAPALLTAGQYVKVVMRRCPAVS